MNTHIRAIETFESTAIAKAKETVEKVDVELKDLQATLANIEDARPFEDLTVRFCADLFFIESDGVVMYRSRMLELHTRGSPKQLRR